MRTEILVLSSVLALGSCGGAARGVVPAVAGESGALGNAVEVAGVPRDGADARGRWRVLAPTALGYEAQLAELDAEPATAAAMARTLLRDGGFACEDVIVHNECGDEWTELDALDPGATFDDPCLRRRLALWALSRLEPGDAAGLHDVLVGLVAMRAPEAELQAAAFDAVEDDAQRLALLAVADEALAEEQVAALEGDDAILRAATELHLDAAVLRLVERPAAHRDALLGALDDDALGVDTRAAVLAAFADDPGADVTTALVALADDVDCGLAARAAEALAVRGDASYLPARPDTRDPEAHLRALCVLGASSLDDRLERLSAWIGRRGVITVDESYDDYHDPSQPQDPDDTDLDDDGEMVEHDGSMTRITRRVAPAELDGEALLARLALGGSCAAGSTHCTLVGGEVVALAAAGRSLVIAELSETRYSGCGC